MDNRLIEKLKIFVDSIEKQMIYLVRLDFVAKEKIVSKSIDEFKLDHNLKIEISDTKKNRNKNFIIVSLDYNFLEQIFLKKRREQLLKMNIIYKLDLFLKLSGKSQNLFYDKEVIESYANSSGLLTVFPYIRHLSDHIHKELRLGLEPYPPMKIKLNV